METEDDSDVPDTGAVFTYGKSQFGDNTPNKFWIRDDRVTKVACGDEHTVFVAESGRVFTFGVNEWGQLGLNHNKIVKKPTRIKSLKAEKVIQVACGRSHTLVATESGKLFSFGANSEGQLGLGSTDNVSTPRQVEGLPECRCTGLGAGTDHSLALLENGEVYVWGSNSDGQLGLGEAETEAWQPVKLPLDERVASVACGYYHSAIVTVSGVLYTFGETEMGKLGQGDEPEDNKTPSRVSMIEDRVVGVACGGNHTAVITAGSKLYTFGEGANGQLGHGTTLLNTDKPVPVLLPKGTKVKHVSCGENHTAIISEKGQLLTFGDGRHGKLALGEENFSNQFLPTLVQRFSRFTVEKVSCGGCHMLITACPRTENGDVTSSESEDEDASEDSDEDKPANTHNSNFKRGEWNGSIRSSMDLNGSFSARNRRREKLPDPGDTINRTMPPLHSSAPGRGGLQPLSATLPALNHRGGPQPLDRGKLPALRTQVLAKEASSRGRERQKEEEDESGVSVTSGESDDGGQAIKPQTSSSTKSVPLAKPRPLSRGKVKDPDNKTDEDEVEENKKESHEDEKEDDANSDEEKALVTNVTDAEAESLSEGVDEIDNIEPIPVPALRSKPQKSRSSEDNKEDSEDQSESEDEDKKKSKKKSPKPKKKAKKKSALFGKKKMDVSDSESEDPKPKVDESEDEKKEDSESEKEEKTPKLKKRGKAVKTKKKKKKEDSEDEENEESEREDKKTKKKSKKAKHKESDDEDSEEESEKIEKKTKKEKEKKKKKKKKEDSEDERSEDDEESEEKEKKKKFSPRKSKHRFGKRRSKIGFHGDDDNDKIDETRVERKDASSSDEEELPPKSKSKHRNKVKPFKVEDSVSSLEKVSDLDEKPEEKKDDKKDEPKEDSETEDKPKEEEKKEEKPQEKKKSKTCTIL